MIQVVNYDPIQNIVTIDVMGMQPQTQATPPSGLWTQQDWLTWLASVVQPVVDSLIKGASYDPMQLSKLGDLTNMTGVLTSAETAALNQLFPNGTVTPPAQQAAPVGT